MGYFSNGTEGEIYEAEYCEKCIHYGDEEQGCPIWGAHLCYNYSDEDTDARNILDMLIPQKEIGNGQCEMFIEKEN